MLKRYLVVITGLTLVTQLAQAACEDVIALSKVSASTVRDSASFDNEARNFCKTQAEARQKASQAGGSLGYNGFSVGGNAANSSSQMNYEQVCSADNSGSVRTDAYQSYVDTIAPGAFTAYERCLQLQGQSGIKFAVDVAPKDLRIVAKYGTDMANAKRQTLRYVAPAAVSCTWESSQATIKDKTAALAADSSASLQCVRASTDEEHTVQVFVDTMSAEPLFLRWKTYQGTLPADALKALNDRVQLAESSLQAAMAALSKGVVAFNSERCPDGWDEFKPAYGMFVRGIDRSKSVDPDGERKAGTFQADAFAEHTHTHPRNLIQDVGAISQSNVPTAKANTYSFATLPGVTNPAGNAKETRPKNVALLYCIRQ